MKIQRASAALADQYELIDLGVTGPEARANLGLNDMNASGVLVGNMYIDAEKDSPWVFRDGTMSRIKTGEYGARVSCINGAGVMGGRDLRGWHTEEQPWGFPVLWIDGEKEVLPFPDGLPSPGEEGRVFDINDEGVAVGDVSIAGGTTVPVIWRDGRAEILPGYEPGGRGGARFINNNGMVVGDLTVEGRGGGVVWTEFGIESFTIDGIEGATMFGFLGLDEFDRILGTVNFGDANGTAAHSNGNGGVPTLFAPGVEGETFAGVYCSLGANLFGGYSSTGDKAQAYVWDNGVPIEVRSLVKNTRGLRLTTLNRFSDDGWMAGNAIDKDGARHPFLLMPA
ncbi:MAG: hypothetical protein IT334_10935 [Thermomicrobiales bacterium]|nr:hypothetical protein [Thermomicrobiales bacterium]